MPSSRPSTETPRPSRAGRSSAPKQPLCPIPDVAADERGSASLEFLAVGLILLVPLVYLVLALAAVQAGALAVEGAARHAARIAVQHDGGGAGGAVDRAVRVALADYGIDSATASVTMHCSHGDCSTAGSRISVAVSARVALPLVPDLLSATPVASVQLQSSATQTVSRFTKVE